MLIEDELIHELKAVKEIRGIHEAQLLTYMKRAGIKTGLLINLNVTQLKNGNKNDTFYDSFVLFVSFVVFPATEKTYRMSATNRVRLLLNLILTAQKFAGDCVILIQSNDRLLLKRIVILLFLLRFQ